MYQPVAKNENMKYGNNRWKAYSEKLGRDVFLSSQLEYDHWVLVETDYKVIEYCEQPVKVYGIYNGEERYSIIDMWLKQSGCEEFNEIKYTSELEQSSPKYEDTKRQISIQKQWCEEHGFIHRVLTDKEIYKNKILLSNKKVILPYIKDFKNIVSNVRLKVLNSIFNGADTFKKLSESNKDLTRINIQTIVFELIYREFIDSNISEVKLGRETRFYLDGKTNIS